MTKTLTKICTVALMLMMSMRAMAIDIKIESFTGGEISATQGDEKDGKVTVTLTVMPYDGYTITKDDIYVYATISPSETRGNSPTISERISLDGKDPDDASEKRDYTFTITTNFGVWVKEATFISGSKGGGGTRTDYSGVYFIASDGKGPANDNSYSYNSSTPASNFYLCPTEGWCYYQATDDFTGTDNGMPFLTTYKCRSDDYHSGNPNDAIWIIEKAPAPNSNYYYIRQASTGNYLTSNGTIRTTGNADRMRVHVETIAPEDLDDKELFTIATYSTYLTISPKGMVGGAADRNWLTVNNGNNNSLEGASGKTGGPTGYTDTAGIIGVYTQNDANAKFYLEKALSIDAPTITNNYDGTITITAASDATIYFTTNGDAPTTSTLTTGTTSVTVNITEGVTVIKAIAKATNDPFPTNVTTYYLPVCERPVISVSGSTVTITCTTEGTTIHYTTDGSPATSDSPVYTGPFAKGSATTIRAIATKAGYVISSEATLLPPTEVSSSDDITDMTGNYILASNFSQSASVGSASEPFSGTIDGNMVTLSGFDKALVAYADGATIKNVILDNVNISGNANGNAGAICCEATGDTRIYNCGVKSGTISGTNAGSIVGKLDGYSRVINCYSFATVSGGTWGAGIVGYNSFSSTISDLRTMVMNCMFYGEISSGTNISPIYGGLKITNVSNLNGYNYYRFDADYSRNNSITAYNCALAAEEKYLTRFEFFRNTLNSNRELAAWYAIGDPNEGKGIGNACEMAKWVLDIAEKPYPILKAQDYYPSVINYEDAPTLGTISLTIDESNDKPEGASINQDYPTTLTVYDKDLAHNHFNYRTVRLPYYNEVGTGNCTKNKVVTGWKITGFTDGTQGHFVKGVLDYSGTTHSEGIYPPYNFADRYCTDKDKYSVSGRVFSQGAYYDVPEGVTGITIEPYWGTAVYLSDPTYDVAYPKGYGNNNANAVFVSNMGDRYVNGNTASINGDDQTVYTTYSNAFGQIASSGTVYDNAIVLVGNYHHYWGQNYPSTTKAFTIMSADLNNDCEPDYGFIVQHGTGRQNISAIRFDFINSPGLGMIQKVETDKAIPKHGIWCPKGWFEVTNTTLIEFTQFEYDRGGKSAGSPLILLGGIYDQFITARQNVANSTEYIHLGSNIWMKEFCNGVHTNASNSHTTRHIPISVTGGEFESFYLTGTFRPSVTSVTDNAECYINGGKFGDMAGAGQEQLKGDVTWLIDHADITNFYGGGINGQKPVTGNIYVEINNSQVELYCGGPKFGNMQANMKVTTKAKGSTFGNFYGAGYGGTSYFRDMTRDVTGGSDWDTWVGDYTRKYVAGKGISTAYECEFIPYSGGQSGQPDYVGRFYVLYASLSLAETKDVESTLEDCNITGSFYGGGKLGRVDGNIISTLNNCTVGDNVYGAGFSASVENVNVVPKGAKMNPNPAYNESVGVFTDGTYPDGVPYTWTQVASISAGKEFDDEKKYIYTTVDLTTLGTVTGNVTLTINGNTEADENGKVMTVGKSVYGGGEESAVGGNTNVNINAGKVMGNVYGGGNQANVGGNTLINLKGGIVANNVFGGGKGDDEHYATVGGNTDVKLNETVEDDNCIVNGNIFGCNDVNGTPLGNATVHIYKTNGDARTASGDLESIDDTKHKYHLNAVYGGGNLAAYIPTAGDAKANVIIDGCDMTSIRTVYGGGNAASTPATSVEVNGTYEIEEVFGGGNGKDALPDGSDNPGANVGFKNYSADEATYDTKEKRQSEEFVNQYVYGSGKANVTIVGGRVHRVFGGSNTKGNVRITAVTMLDDIGGCHFIVDEAYGGGKSAPMDGEAKLLMSCIPGLKVAYGGAENANILGDVTLNITNGNFDRVFGGNNISGTIGGKITVNIEETGCSPIIIGQLFGGGNQAPYDAKGQTGPTLNIKSFTSIGEVYGGGYGVSATVTGDTHVNINEVKGRFTAGTHNYGTPEAPIGVDSKTGNRTISFSEFVRNKNGDYLDADGNVTEDESERAIVNKTINVYIPEFTANKIGGIGMIYGGGNEAEVVGNTHVNIGTQSTIDFVTGVGSDAPQTDVSVEGADIRGNVYGGGNKADVTGNTNVNIGLDN